MVKYVREKNEALIMEHACKYFYNPIKFFNVVINQ